MGLSLLDVALKESQTISRSFENSRILALSDSSFRVLSWNPREGVMLQKDVGRLHVQIRCLQFYSKNVKRTKERMIAVSHLSWFQSNIQATSLRWVSWSPCDSWRSWFDTCIESGSQVKVTDSLSLSKRKCPPKLPNDVFDWLEDSLESSATKIVVFDVSRRFASVRCLFLGYSSMVVDIDSEAAIWAIIFCRAGR